MILNGSPATEQDVRNVMISGVDDKSLDSSDSPIRGIYVLAPADTRLTHWHTVSDDRMGPSSQAHAAHAHTYTHAKWVVRQRENLLLLVTRCSARSQQELCLLGVLSIWKSDSVQRSRI